MPPLTTGNSPALVGGAVPSKETDMKAPQPDAQPTTLKVKALRSFYFSGKPIPVNTEVELPRVFALEMHAANKVQILPSPEPVAPSFEVAPEVKPKPENGKKGGRHAA
jgi:hypothetical protein